MPAAMVRYVGARTPFGVIVRVGDRLFNPTALVKATDGSTAEYRLPFLIASGVTLSERIQA